MLFQRQAGRCLDMSHKKKCVVCTGMGSHRSSSSLKVATSAPPMETPLLVSPPNRDASLSAAPSAPPTQFANTKNVSLCVHIGPVSRSSCKAAAVFKWSGCLLTKPSVQTCCIHLWQCSDAPVTFPGICMLECHGTNGTEPRKYNCPQAHCTWHTQDKLH